MVSSNIDTKNIFNRLRDQLLSMDPVGFVEKYLTLDGKPFRLSGNGYKPLSDIYRYLGIKALEPDALPVIVVKGRQIGATTMASALEMYFMGSGLFGVGDKPPIRVMHAFPLLGHAAAYSKTKLSAMINHSVQLDGGKPNSRSKSYMQSLLDTSAASNDSLQFKQFVGGNHLWVESIGLNAERVVGRTADVMLFDEFQSMNTYAVGNALKILTTAKYGKVGKGVTMFFGTPRKKGSDFHKMWQRSTQQYYHLGCEKCKQHFPFYTPDPEHWEKVWLHGFIVKCTLCGHEQDKRDAAERGKWISFKSKDDEDCIMIGFHLNQLYMPTFTREDIENEKPGIHVSNTERLYHNEVLGEFYQGDSSPITPEEIRDLCGDVGRKFRAKISPGEENMVILGLDYGSRADLEQIAKPELIVKGGQSYSTAVVLSVKGAGLLSIEYATKFKRNDPESKKGLIDQIYRQYNIQLGVGDIGYSNDFSYILYTMYGDKYLVSRAHSKVNDHVKFNKDSFPKEIVFERDFYIRELYEQMKKGQIRFPFGDYEKIGWLIEHCSSMDIKVSLPRSGDPVPHYVKGSTPNDGFMALLNAYIGYRFLISKGFTSNNPLLNTIDMKNKNKPLILTGYIPRKM